MPPAAPFMAGSCRYRSDVLTKNICKSTFRIYMPFLDRTSRIKRLKFAAHCVGPLTRLVNYRNREKRQEIDSVMKISPE